MDSFDIWMNRHKTFIYRYMGVVFSVVIMDTWTINHMSNFSSQQIRYFELLYMY